MYPETQKKMNVFPIKPGYFVILVAVVFYLGMYFGFNILFPKPSLFRDTLFTMLIFLGFLIPLAPHLDKMFNYFKRKQTIQSGNYQGNLQASRSLSESETTWLVNEIQSLEKHRHFGYVTLAIAIFLMLVLVPLGLLEYSHPMYRYIPYVVALVVINFTATAYLFRGDVQSPNNVERDTVLNQYKKDLASPVMQVQGRSILEYYPQIKVGRLTSRSAHYELWVHNTMFKYPQLSPFLETINNGDLISIEYSPHSRHIWREEKHQPILKN